MRTCHLVVSSGYLKGVGLGKDGLGLRLLTFVLLVQRSVQNICKLKFLITIIWEGVGILVGKVAGGSGAHDSIQGQRSLGREKERGRQVLSVVSLSCPCTHTFLHSCKGNLVQPHYGHTG